MSNSPDFSILRSARQQLEDDNVLSAFESVSAILANDASNPDAIELMGDICIADQQWLEAERFLKLAAALRTEDIDIRLKVASAIRAQKHYRRAIAEYESILRLVPDEPRALAGLANCQRDEGIRHEAIDNYTRSLKSDPQNPIILLNRALCAIELNRLDEAIVDLHYCLEKDNNFALARKNLARAQLLNKDYEASVHNFRLYLADNPEDHSSRCELASALANNLQRKESLHELEKVAIRSNDLAILGRVFAMRFSICDLHGAEATLHKLLSLDPGNPIVLFDLATCQRELGRIEQSLETCNQGLVLKPDFSMAYVNRGLIFAAVERFHEAITDYQTALSIDPDCLDAHINIAVAYGKLCFWEKATTHFDLAIGGAPDHADYRWNYSLFLLLMENYREGFLHYEARWQRNQRLHLKRKLPGQLIKHIDDINDEIVCIISEQGLGDTIQFARYIVMIENRASKVYFVVEQALQRLFSSSLRSTSVLSENILPAEATKSAYLLSLPHLYDTTVDTVPTPIALTVPQEHIKRWEARLGPKTKPRVGVVWQGNRAHTNDQNRSIPLNLLGSNLPKGIEYIALQNAITPGDIELLDNFGIMHVESALRDFLDTAALCCNLDLVVSVDTSVAHLAATLPMKTWILIPRPPDWRWGLFSQESVWYSSVRLYRQSAQKDWAPVLQQLRIDLLSEFRLS